MGPCESAAADVSELSAADDGLDGDVLRVDLLGELLHGGLRESLFEIKGSNMKLIENILRLHVACDIKILIELVIKTKGVLQKRTRGNNKVYFWMPSLQR